ncbi:hypothetical protein MTJW_06240 [Moorella thermoacetica]|nr:hypothetical protein MTJW_06240 [Moorella thermoacetica]
MKVAKIKPGDWVEIIPCTNKITIKLTKHSKSKGAVLAELRVS